MRRLSSLREEVERWDQLAQRVHDALEFATLGDDSLTEELEVNLPGVAVIIRLREELGTSRARIEALVRALRDQS